MTWRERLWLGWALIASLWAGATSLSPEPPGQGGGGGAAIPFCEVGTCLVVTGSSPSATPTPIRATPTPITPTITATFPTLISPSPTPRPCAVGGAVEAGPDAWYTYADPNGYGIPQNVRQRPTTSAPILYTLPRGQRVRVLWTVVVSGYRWASLWWPEEWPLPGCDRWALSTLGLYEPGEP